MSNEKHVLYYGLGLLTAALCLFLNYGTSLVSAVATGLILACLLSAKLMFQYLGKPKGLPLLLNGAALVLVLWQYAGAMLPAAAVILAEMAEELAGSKGSVPLSAAAIILLILILEPDRTMLVLLAAVILPLWYTSMVLHRLQESRLQQDRRSEEIQQLRQAVTSQRQSARTLEYATRLEERNRLAARIHDKIGHGVSGSILLVEAAMLVMDSDPQKAKDTLLTASGNLRESVDEIRTALRGERSSKSDVGLAEIRLELDKFSAEHPGVATRFTAEGTLEEISFALWRCIYENMLEALTNLLKHSSADIFSVKIVSLNKLLHVEFSDNGATRGYQAGTGLLTMEERCAMNRGRCFFNAGSHGFTISMTFPITGQASPAAPRKEKL